MNIMMKFFLVIKCESFFCQKEKGKFHKQDNRPLYFHSQKKVANTEFFFFSDIFKQQMDVDGTRLI